MEQCNWVLHIDCKSAVNISNTRNQCANERQTESEKTQFKINYTCINDIWHMPISFLWFSLGFLLIKFLLIIL